MYKTPQTYKTSCTVFRRAKRETYTISDFYVDDIKKSDSLEDPVRDLNKDGDLLDEGETKIWGQTAIPYTPDGYCYMAWIETNEHYGRHLRLFGVNQFDGILVHTGATPEHTHGCILPGINSIKGMVVKSRISLDKIIDELLTHVKMGEKFPFFIKDAKIQQ